MTVVRAAIIPYFKKLKQSQNIYSAIIVIDLIVALLNRPVLLSRLRLFLDWSSHSLFFVNFLVSLAAFECSSFGTSLHDVCCTIILQLRIAFVRKQITILQRLIHQHRPRVLPHPWQLGKLKTTSIVSIERLILHMPLDGFIAFTAPSC